MEQRALHSRGRLWTYCPIASLNNCSFSYGTSIGSLMRLLKHAWGDRVEFIIREPAKDPLANVARSFVKENMTVVVKRLTSSTSHQPDPEPSVSALGSDT